MTELIHKELSEQIIGASMDVLNALGPGLLEKIYERALVIELRERGLEVSQQSKFDVYFREQLVGELIPDMIVEDRVIVDTKVVASFNDYHLAQMTGYLAITKLNLGLLVNFKYGRLKWKRIVR